MSFSATPLGKEPIPAAIIVAPPPRAWPAGGLNAVWTLFTLTFRHFLRGKRAWVVLFLSLLPAGLVVLVRAVDHGLHGPSPLTLEFVFLFVIIPHSLLSLTAMLYGSGLILDEQEEQTLTYLLIRPLSKWSIYLTKLLAALVMANMLMVFFVLLTFAATYLGTEDWWEVLPKKAAVTIGLMALAMTAYTALFGMLGLLIKRSLIFGIAFIGIFEGLLANFEFAIRQISVMYYFRVLCLRWLDLDVQRSIWKIPLDDTTFSAGECVLTLALIAVLPTLASCWVFSRNEYHVKTPEST